MEILSVEILSAEILWVEMLVVEILAVEIPVGKSRPWYESRRLCVSVLSARRRFLHGKFIEKVRVHVSRLRMLYDSNLFFKKLAKKLKKYRLLLCSLSSLSSSRAQKPTASLLHGFVFFFVISRFS